MKRSQNMGLHLIGVLGCATLLAAVWLFALMPLTENRREAEGLRTRLASLQSEMDQQRASHNRFERRLADIGEELDRIPVRLQAIGRMNARIAVLTDMADKSGVRVQSITPGAPLSRPHYRLVDIRLQGEGSYRAGLRLLNDIHEQLGDVHVVGFELVAINVAAKPVTRIDLQLRWYALPASDLASVE